VNIYHFLNLFFYFEILVLVLVLLFILIKRVVYFFSSRQELYRKKKLSEVLSACFLKKQKCELIQKVHTKKLLLEVLEVFNHRFSGQEWDLLKQSLCERFLLKKARRFAKSYQWTKRNFAARVFALSPLKQDENIILELMEDQHFLVASIASCAAIKLSSEKGIIKALKKLSQAEGYERFFYADLLSQGSGDVFYVISSTSLKNYKLHLAVLDVLSLETSQVQLKFLLKDLKSHDENIKIAAFKVAFRNPHDEWEDIFIKDMNHDNEIIRKLSAECLSKYPSKASFHALSKGLLDKSVSVKLASAKSLKVLGKSDLIKDQSLKKYVLEFE
jgi:hypothetical protein